MLEEEDQNIHFFSVGYPTEIGLNYTTLAQIIQDKPTGGICVHALRHMKKVNSRLTDEELPHAHLC